MTPALAQRSTDHRADVFNSDTSTTLAMKINVDISAHNCCPSENS